MTHNHNKLLEFRELLSIDIDIIDLDIEEIQALDVEKVAIAKAQFAYNATGKFVIVEDTGLYIEAWNGLPGALTRWFLEALGVQGICNALRMERNRKCYIKTALVACDLNVLETFISNLDGEILFEPRGKYGFGFDAIIQPMGYQKSIAEFNPREKNVLSTRKKVVEQFEQYVKRSNIS